VYIFDQSNTQDWTLGGASRWWLHHALQSLDKSLGGKLNIFSGDALAILSELSASMSAKAVYWNRCYEPQSIDRDANIKTRLKEAGLDVQSFNGSLLWEPWQVLKKDGTPYKVFTPYYRRGCLQKVAPRQPLPVPKTLDMVRADNSLTVEDLSLLPAIDWDKKLHGDWDISENGAKDRLDDFVFNGIQDYREGRNFPNKKNVSRLSPYFHFGQMSVNTAWYAANDASALINNESNLDTF
jgi:deoxyribodipyrimidine photo-lyase